jgi:hypothetical protein
LINHAPVPYNKNFALILQLGASKLVRKQYFFLVLRNGGIIYLPLYYQIALNYFIQDFLGLNLLKDIINEALINVEIDDISLLVFSLLVTFVSDYSLSRNILTQAAVFVTINLHVRLSFEQ